MSETPTPLSTRPPTPEEEGWQAWRRADEQDTPKRLEEAAKFCTGLYGITYAILLGHDSGALKNADSSELKALAVFWLASLLASFTVVFPLPYAFRSDSAISIKAMHKRVVRFKYWALLLGAGLYLAGLLLLTWIYFF